MRIKLGKKAAISLIILMLCGAVGGFINGLLGAGGGIIIIYLLSALLRERASGRDIFANSLCVMFPLSIVSCAVYFSRGGIDLSSIGVLLLPAILGGILGGFALSRVNTSLLKQIFSLLVIVSGVILALK